MTDEEKSTEHTNVVDSVVQKPETVTAESVVTAVSDSEKAVQEDSKIASSETIKEITEAELEHATTEPAEKVSESSPLAGVASSTNEEKTIGTNSIPPLAPSTPPPQQQPRPGMTRPLGPQVQRMGVPRMAGPRMGAPRMSGPRMAGPRQPGPQKPPEPAPFSGFMSMFSAPNTQSKSPTVGGFFSSSAASLFGSSPAPRQPPPQPQQQHQQQQQKSSFFGLPSSIASESLTSDLLGMFKGPETTKPEETQQSGTQCRPDELSASVTDCAITEKPEIPLSEDGHVKSTESELPEKGLVEETEQKETEAEGNSLTESIIQTTEKQSGDDEHVEHSEGPVTAVSDKAAPPTAPENKGIFEIPGLTAPKLGFLSVAAEGTSSIGSLFSTSTSPATASKAPQTQQTDGGLFSGFKSLSAGIFHDEKSTGKEEASVSSVFGMKLTSMFGNSDSPRPESTPPVVSVEPQSETPKPTECEDPEPDQPSPGSGETESEDGSDTEGPTETSKTGSCDSLAQSPLSGVPSHSVSQIESLDTPQLMVTPCELDKSEVNAPDVVHAELEMDQPKEQLTKEAMKSPPDSSHFDSSGNLSPVSSQLSSEPEERRHVESCHPSKPRPPLQNQPSNWNKEEEDDAEKDVHALPEPGSKKDLKDSSDILPKPTLDNCDNKRQTNGFFVDGPPPCSPSKVRWLKAYNKVRVKLHEKAVVHGYAPLPQQQTSHTEQCYRQCKTALQTPSYVKNY
ncbi:proteoglycan 4-like [Pundamilia nyererei]|uniref:Proteoglycan 4-like n=1 Tax=Pundamilia nyererei TaxID=303518 RepID=A0A9Y6J933_9CICH|nr:PREDICTED: proteoglycan 4-like [Pundamilia nyererei]